MVNPPSANDQTSSPLNSLSQLYETQPCLPVIALCFFCYSTILKSCNIWKLFSWKYLYTEMKWALSAFLPFLIDGLELCEKVILLTPRYICSPVPGWLTRPGTGLYRCPRASLPQKAATGHWTPLPACPRALVHPMAKLEAPGGGVILCLPAPRALPPRALRCVIRVCRLFAMGKGGMFPVMQVGSYHWSGFSSSLLMFSPVSTAFLTDTSRQIYFLLGMHRFKIRWQYYKGIIYFI